jgi:hypothetical protein
MLAVHSARPPLFASPHFFLQKFNRISEGLTSFNFLTGLNNNLHFLMELVSDPHLENALFAY